MELDQIVKRLEWLEEERRKDKSTITTLQENIASFEGSFASLKEQIKKLSGDLIKFSSLAARIDQFDTTIAQYRTDVGKSIETSEKRRDKSDNDLEKRRRTEIDNINKSLADLHKSLEAIPDIKKNLQVRADEDARLARLVAETEHRVDDVLRADEDIKRTYRAQEENRKQDAKRIADAQGEIAALRKRIDEAREKSDVNADLAKQLDIRINELLTTETERRQQQSSFMEQQSLQQLERDRAWKEWTTRFDSFSRQTSALDSQLAALDETQRAVKRSQDAFDEINTRLERRINEITEMQRLAEDRFRQEWTTFKSDDQKRWTNYSLSQEEVLRDIRKEIEKISERLTTMEDSVQTQSDQLEQTTQTTEQQMQELMNWAHEWLTNYERIMGHARVGK